MPHYAARLMAAGICLLPAAAQAGTLKTLYTFGSQANDGENPLATLAVANGVLFGTTQSGGTVGDGTVFSVDPSTGAETVVHSFTGGNDANFPANPLTLWQGTLYGTSQDGGLGGFGALYSVDPASGAEAVLYQFPIRHGLPDSPLIPFAGHLVGAVSCGSVFKFAAASGRVTFLPCEAQKQGTLLWGVTAVHGVLYGANYEDGPGNDFGTLVSIDPKQGSVTVLHGFPGGTDGYGPVGVPLYHDGKLYGTTYAGGAGNCSNGCGVVYSYDIASGQENVLYTFLGGKDGAKPFSGLTYWHGRLFGALNGQVAGVPPCPQMNACGAIFSLDPATGAEKTEYAFTGGANGYGPLVQPIVYNDALYGTTYRGDDSNCGQYGVGCGTVYRLTP